VAGLPVVNRFNMIGADHPCGIIFPAENNRGAFTAPLSIPRSPLREWGWGRGQLGTNLALPEHAFRDQGRPRGTALGWDAWALENPLDPN
jgi:hypothetical protein